MFECETCLRSAALGLDGTMKNVRGWCTDRLRLRPNGRLSRPLRCLLRHETAPGPEIRAFRVCAPFTAE
jgi:hypothetical protein